MTNEICAKVLVVGDNIDTDVIYPGRYLELTDPVEIGRHCLEGLGYDVAAEFPKGGIIVAGRNFGCGSSREHAPISLVNMGASAVLADSFARIFFRNGINLGLPLIVCKGIAKHVENDQTLNLNIAEGTVTVVETGDTETVIEVPGGNEQQEDTTPEGPSEREETEGGGNEEKEEIVFPEDPTEEIIDEGGEVIQETSEAAPAEVVEEKESEATPTEVIEEIIFEEDNNIEISSIQDEINQLLFIRQAILGEEIVPNYNVYIEEEKGVEKTYKC